MAADGSGTLTILKGNSNVLKLALIAQDLVRLRSVWWQQSEQFAHRLLKHRMHHIRRDLGQRFEYKPPLRHSRMRHGQLRRVDGLRAEQQDVDIDHAWAFRLRANPAHRLLNDQDTRQKFTRR